jgi:hypothetical protein
MVVLVFLRFRRESRRPLSSICHQSLEGLRDLGNQAVRRNLEVHRIQEVHQREGSQLRHVSKSYYREDLRKTYEVHLQGGHHGLQSQAGHQSQVRQGILLQSQDPGLQHQAKVQSNQLADRVQRGAQLPVQQPVLQR